MIKLDVLTGKSTLAKQKLIEKLYGGAEKTVFLSATDSLDELPRAVAVADTTVTEKIVIDLDSDTEAGDCIKRLYDLRGAEVNLVLGCVESGLDYSGERLRAVTDEADAVILCGFNKNDINATVEKIKENNPRVTVTIGEDIKSGKTLIGSLEDGKRILNLFSADIKNLFNEKH